MTIQLTPKMRQILLRADLQRGEMCEAALGTLYGLVNRGLADDSWKLLVSGEAKSQAATAVSFPIYRVMLTAAGLLLSREFHGKS